MSGLHYDWIGHDVQIFHRRSAMAEAKFIRFPPMALSIGILVVVIVGIALVNNFQFLQDLTKKRVQ